MKIIGLLLGVLPALAIAASEPEKLADTVAPAVIPNALGIYDETADLVTKNFYDQSFRGLSWAKMVAAYRRELMGPIDEEGLKKSINKLVAELHSSHTEFLSDTDQEYWGLE